MKACGRKIRARGLCAAHYTRLQKHGDVLADVPVGKKANGNSLLSMEERFAQNVDKQGPWCKRLRSRCHTWTGDRSTNGYGRFTLNGRRTGAHRVAYFLGHGVWPVECRHRCDNKSCVRLDHLDDGTRADNIQDSLERGLWSNGQAKKTHCPKGHKYTKANTRIDRRGHRRCIECGRSEARGRYRKKHPNARRRRA